MLTNWTEEQNDSQVYTTDLQREVGRSFRDTTTKQDFLKTLYSEVVSPTLNACETIGERTRVQSIWAHLLHAFQMSERTEYFPVRSETFQKRGF